MTRRQVFYKIRLILDNAGIKSEKDLRMALEKWSRELLPLPRQKVSKIDGSNIKHGEDGL